MDAGEPNTNPITLGPTSVADALRHARESAGLSVSALARAAETSRAAVHAYETGTREPNISTAIRLLQRCGHAIYIVPDR